MEVSLVDALAVLLLERPLRQSELAFTENLQLFSCAYPCGLLFCVLHFVVPGCDLASSTFWVRYIFPTTERYDVSAEQDKSHEQDRSHEQHECVSIVHAVCI